MGLAMLAGGLFAILAWNPRSPPQSESMEENAAPLPDQVTARPQDEIDRLTHRTAILPQAMTIERKNESKAVLNLRASDDAQRHRPKQTIVEETYSLELTATRDAVTTPKANSRGPPR